MRYVKSLMLLSLALCIACNLLADPPVENPNIIYILVDDLGYGDLNLDLDGTEVFRNPFITTPNLAALAAESLVFTDHYASSPVCSPSRAGLLTGRTPTRANINRWIADLKFDGQEFLRDGEVTLAEIFNESG